MRTPHHSSHAESTRDLRSPIRHASPPAQWLAAAAMDSCKPCRWAGALDVADNLSPDGVIAELYRVGVEHTVLAALAEGRQLPSRFVLEEMRFFWPGVGHWPQTAATRPLCTVTIEGTSVRVNIDRVLTRLQGLTRMERAHLVDDLVDVIVGAEYYPPDKIPQFLATA